jgi:P27 family predicted phage terminase small subunit
LSSDDKVTCHFDTPGGGNHFPVFDQAFTPALPLKTHIRENRMKTPPPPPPTAARPGSYPDKTWPAPVKQMWDSYCHNYAIVDLYGRDLLRTACDAYREMLQAEEVIKQHGILIKSPTGALRENPACSTLRGARHAYRSALRALNFDEAPPGKVGAPSYGRG